MDTISVKKHAEAMKDIDYCMMTTADGHGTLHSRPMSNNREVDYDGESYFFSDKDTQKVRDLEQSPPTSFTYQGKDGMFIHIYGESFLTDEKERMADPWSDDLNQWFKDGLDTKGLIMIWVDAKKIHYGQNEKEGEVSLR